MKVRIHHSWGGTPTPAVRVAHLPAPGGLSTEGTVRLKEIQVWMCLYKAKRKSPCSANLWSGDGQLLHAACQPGYPPSSFGVGWGHQLQKFSQQSLQDWAIITSPVKTTSFWSGMNTWNDAPRAIEIFLIVYVFDDVKHWLNICKVHGTVPVPCKCCVP